MRYRSASPADISHQSKVGRRDSVSSVSMSCLVSFFSVGPRDVINVLSPCVVRSVLVALCVGIKALLKCQRMPQRWSLWPYRYRVAVEHVSRWYRLSWSRLLRILWQKLPRAHNEMRTDPMYTGVYGGGCVFGRRQNVLLSSRKLVFRACQYVPECLSGVGRLWSDIGVSWFRR